METIPQAIPNMVRNVRSLCAHRVRSTSPMRSRRTIAVWTRKPPEREPGGPGGPTGPYTSRGLVLCQRMAKLVWERVGAWSEQSRRDWPRSRRLMADCCQTEFGGVSGDAGRVRVLDPHKSVSAGGGHWSRLFQPRIKLPQRQLALLSVPFLAVADLVFQRGQKIERNVRGLEVLCVSVGNVVHQGTEGGLTRWRHRV